MKHMYMNTRCGYMRIIAGLMVMVMIIVAIIINPAFYSYVWAEDEELKDDFDIVPAQLCNADDDFALYQECIPGFYGFLGSGGNGTLHQSNYRCDDAGLTYGARFHELAATALLKWVRA